MNLRSLLDNLLKEGKIKKQKSDVHYMNGLLNAAHNNFLAAKYNVDGGFWDTAFKSTYDGLLQISRVVLFLNRPLKKAVVRIKSLALLKFESG